MAIGWPSATTANLPEPGSLALPAGSTKFQIAGAAAFAASVVISSNSSTDGVMTVSFEEPSAGNCSLDSGATAAPVAQASRIITKRHRRQKRVPSMPKNLEQVG